MNCFVASSIPQTSFSTRPCCLLLMSVLSKVDFLWQEPSLLELLQGTLSSSALGNAVVASNAFVSSFTKHFYSHSYSAPICQLFWFPEIPTLISWIIWKVLQDFTRETLQYSKLWNLLTLQMETFPSGNVCLIKGGRLLIIRQF